MLTFIGPGTEMARLPAGASHGALALGATKKVVMLTSTSAFELLCCPHVVPYRLHGRGLIMRALLRLSLNPVLQGSQLFSPTA